MAVKFKELYDAVYLAPLSPLEIEQVDATEKWIDAEIRRKYTEGTEIRVDLCVYNFSWDPVTATSTFFSNPRKALMSAELERRYAAAGWKIRCEFDDGIGGQDHWVLTGSIPKKR
jgi:hypothetical protein